MNSKIILCKGIGLDRNYVNVLDYNESKMIELCNQKRIAYAEDYSFLDVAKGVIYTGFNYDVCLQANYIAFQNPNYSNKWFFGFIDDVIYKGDKNTEIRFSVDSWSTWFSSWTPKACYIIREHVNDDSVGLHTIPENIDVGRVFAESVRYQDWSSQAYVGMLTNYKPGLGGNYSFDGVSIYNRTCFGSKLLIFPMASSLDFSNLNAFVKRANLDGHIEDIKDIFWIPYSVIDVSTMIQNTFDYNGTNYNVYDIPYSDTIYQSNISFAKPLTFNDYVPKNNKLKVYPYNYLYITNDNGQENLIKIEDFNSTNCEFTEEFAISVGGSGRLVPHNYKESGYNYNESISLSKFPTIQWSSDSYTNWLTQNAVSEQNTLIRNGIEQTKNAMKLDVGNALISASNLILDAQERFYTASLLPQKVGGTSTGDVAFSTRNICYEIKRMRPTKEYLQIIDDFFTRFGYKINRLKVPNITGRRNFNYIEISGSDEIGFGDVPTKYMEQINNSCRKGVTIWHNHDNIGNYLINNDII